MEHENFTIEIEGRELEDLYPDLSSLAVELDDELAGMFRLHMPLSPNEMGRYLDDGRLTIWKQVSISAGFCESGAEVLISGYITHVKPAFSPDPAGCGLEIWGMDRSVLMDREEKLKAWPDKKDSDIASEILNQYGFTPEVEETSVVHDEVVSTIIQRETDMQFLRRLAERNGFECYVDGDTAYFGPPRLDDAPQPVLSAHFGPEGDTNLSRFDVEVNALTPMNVAMFQVDRSNKEILETAVEASEQTALGSDVASDLLPAGVAPGKLYVGMSCATGTPEMTSLCQGLYHLGEWFVTGEGEIDANQYGHVLRPRSTVTIRGVGEMLSGVYYVTHVTHAFTTEGYKQHFHVKRNGTMPTGSENFGSAGSGTGWR
jgi:hypothetical protein